MSSKTVVGDIKLNYPNMFSAEKKVADYILGNPEEAVMTNVSELANLSGVSDATVIRMCKRAGYEGYYQMKIKLSNDLGRKQFDSIANGSEHPQTPRDLLQILASNIISLSDSMDNDILSACVDLIKKAEMVHLVAAGNTCPIANDFGFRLERFGVRCTYSMISEYMLNQINLAGEGDIVIAISHSGSSKQVVQALELAKEKKLKIIAITGFEYSPVSSLADYLLLAKTEKSIFMEYGPASHISIAAVLDILLYFIANKEINHIDDVELMLSEYKL